MNTHGRRKRAGALAVTAVVVALVSAACDSNSDKGGSPSGNGASGGAGIAAARAQVAKFVANPPLVVSQLPSRPKTSTYAIQLNCTIPACAPGAMTPAMDALGWKFEEMPYDITKGPAALTQSLTQAIAKKPDVIIMSGNFPMATYQSQVDTAVKQGIKFLVIGAPGVPPGYGACIQCASSAEALGALSGDIVLADAGGETGIAVANDKTVPALVSEADGLKNEIKTNGEGSTVSDLEQSVNATPADNASRVVSFLQRNPDVKYLVVTSPQFNPGAALASAGLGSRVKIVGMYPLSEADVTAVKKGQVLSWTVGELGSLYWRAADAAARITMGLPVDPNEPIQSLRVMNADNADVTLLDPADYQSVYKTAWHVQ